MIEKKLAGAFMVPAFFVLDWLNGMFDMMSGQDVPRSDPGFYYTNGRN